MLKRSAVASGTDRLASGTGRLLPITAFIALILAATGYSAHGQTYTVTVNNHLGVSYVGSQTPSYSESVVTLTFPGVTDVVAADMDGDGDIDLVGNSADDDDIAWWENTAGDGQSWTKHYISYYFSDSRGIDAVDVDGDGDTDVLATSSDADSVVWWENTAGDGLSWSNNTIDAYFINATDIKGADIDNDGDMDVAACAGGTHGFAWWENTDGSGDTWTRITIDASTVSSGSALACSDIDGDEDLDIIGASGNAIMWWRNVDGDGSSWTQGSIDTFVISPTSVDSADLDGDGDVDVIGTAGTFGKVIWWENAGGSGDSWTEHTIVSGFGGASTVYAADLDIDGDLDLVAGAGGTTDDVAWWCNDDGDAGSWTLTTIKTYFPEPSSIVVSDLNNDGHPDIVGAGEGSGDISAWLNDATTRRVFFAPVWTNDLCGCSQLVAYVTNTVVTGSWTQRFLRGWSRSGCRPGGGAGRVTSPFALTNNASITWDWGIRNRLLAQPLANGSVDVSNGWYAAGSTGVCEAVPDAYYRFSHWTGTLSSSDNPLPVVMDKAHEFTAVFAPEMATHETPHWWLAQYGLTNGDWNTQAIGDADGDGMATWAEYRAGTDPVQRPSVLRLTASSVQGDQVVVRWSSETNKLYSLQRCTDLSNGFETIAENVPASPAENVYTDAPPAAVTLYYRVELAQ